MSRLRQNLLSRRNFLAHTRFGLGSVALASLLAEQKLLAAGSVAFDPRDPFAPRPPHFAMPAHNVIVVFCAGAVSHVDFWEHKPELVKYHGKPLPGNERLISFQGENGALQQPLWPFRARGACGKMISDIVPHLGGCVDDICFLHSLHTKSSTHGPGENLMSTGFNREGYPGIGGWVSYALGTENQDLPAFVAIEDPRGTPQSGANNWTNGFLPAAFQGAAFSTTRPIRNLRPPPGVSAPQNRGVLDALQTLNEQHRQNYRADSELAARISSYELAARMQLSVPEVMDVEREPEHVRRLYGADSKNPIKADFARNCMLARRLVERGTRFVQLFNGAYASGGRLNWDTHNSMPALVPGHAEILDQPVAGLLTDLKQRGLLENTLVICCTEFGRMPMFQLGNDGRDHNPDGFTVWLAGGGVRGGMSYGATDPLGYKAEQDPLSIHDLHATVLHLLGIEHERLTYYHNGLQRRLTDVHGHVVHEIIA
ncbi:MAG: sulfatase [Planctomycetaceae bacterium]|nr:sulfatase [Planctomycetaceae bacterium]